MPPDPSADALPPDPQTDPRPVPSNIRHLVVGLGASAGGLQALTRFFEAMPASNSMAFVVVLHLSASHESLAAQILQRATRMPVRQVTTSVAIEPEHVYVIPPGHGLSMADGMLVLQPEERVGGRNLAIDVFFRVLAQVHASRSVSVVLSGTGSDGAVGLQRIKEQGGVTFAQSPDDAEQDGMPRAAIATGMVDFVLPAGEMATRLLELARNANLIELPRDVAPSMGKRAPADADDDRRQETALTEIMAILRTRTRHDFRHYKRPTVLRRLERRMQVTGTPTLAAYRDHLRTHPEETAALLQDLLISVTNFFRDRDAFQALEDHVLPALFHRLGSERGVRVWVVGCATGEEAYSISMLLLEAAERSPQSPAFQVFASDIDERALTTARKGLYPSSIITDVTPARLRSFCTPHHDHYRVAKRVRERVLFAQHNVLRDPPFSRVDLIVCRNLLIYLDATAQASVLDTFRFALNPGGALFLGSSESADTMHGHFTTLDKKHRIYRLRSHVPTARTPDLPAPGTMGALTPGTPLPPPRAPTDADLHQRAREAVAPPSVLVDARHKILHMAANVARYMRAPAGAPSQQLLDNTHPDLRVIVRAALFQAQPLAGGVPRVAALEGAMEGVRVRVTVRPLRDPGDEQDLLLVVFEDQGTVVNTTTLDDDAPAEGDAGELQAENRRLQQQLQQLVEHADASTEELMSSNEELQALNEELRSATEELETSREELQSTNEELITVNSELASKVDETGRINDDLQNLINASDIATVFVDRGMHIKRFTPRARELFNLIAHDVGRSLMHITHRLEYPELLADAQSAFETLRLVEREVRSQDGRHFVARMLPYRTAEDHIDGAILSFVDVSSLRRAQQEANAGTELLRLVAESTQDFAITALDDEGRFSAWNAGAENLFGYTAAEILGQPLAAIFTDEDVAAGAPARELASARERGRTEDERWHKRKDGSAFYCSGVTVRLESVRGFAKIARDLTGTRLSLIDQQNQLTRESAGRRRAEATMESKEMFLAVMSHELKHPLNLIHLNAELLARLPEVRNVAVAARAAATIQRTVAGQAKIIDDLLDLSRVRTGKLSLEQSPVDWTESVRRIVEASRADAEERGVRLVFDAGDAPMVSIFDPVRADQVVWNLLSNALKFTPAGGSVRVALAEENEQVRLTVSDTGRGIAPQYLQQVFDMFGQEPGTVRSNDGGMGIGLALVRELVLAQGGRVQVRSEGTGRGAEFTVWVPCHRGDPAPPPRVLAVSVLQGLAVLVVDDSRDSVESLSMLLEITGARVSSAGSGAEALTLLDGQAFDVLVSDISMPGMDGLQLIQAIRAREAAAGGPRMVALACSGYGRQQDEKRAVEAGFDALIAKPVALEAIERVVSGLRGLHKR